MKEMENLDRLSALTVVSAEPADPVAAAVAEIEASMTVAPDFKAELSPFAAFEEDTLSFEPVIVPLKAEVEKEPEEDDDDPFGGPIDLSNLQFGKNFDFD